MKYVVFAFAVFGTPPLALLLWLNLRWARYVIWGMLVSLCVYQATSINFFSHEFYAGTARGMEVGLVHLLAVALLLALFLRKRLGNLLPDWGFRTFALYFLLCLPSLTAAESCMISWFEVWKMMLLFVIWFAAYAYLKATNDVKTILVGFAFFVLANFLFVAKMHYAGVYQPGGIFPHRNSMAMAMNLVGPLFFSAYLMNGVGSWMRGLLALAFIGAVASTIWSYSRGAIAVLPVGYGLAFLACLWERRRTLRKLKRMLPVFLIAVLGIVVMLPRLVERYTKAPQASGDTRVELAYCALEMVKDEPVRGVGINNWSLKLSPLYPYQDNASKIVGRELNYTGIVETVYLLVVAECGIPALLAMLVWFGWYWVACVRLLRHLAGTRWYFIPAGLLGGLTADYMQSTLEWVLRQQINLIFLLFVFALISYLNTDGQRREST